MVGHTRSRHRPQVCQSYCLSLFPVWRTELSRCLSSFRMSASRRQQSAKPALLLLPLLSLIPTGPVVRQCQKSCHNLLSYTRRQSGPVRQRRQMMCHCLSPHCQMLLQGLSSSILLSSSWWHPSKLPQRVVGWCEGAVYLRSPGRPTDIGLQLGKACYPCSW